MKTKIWNKSRTVRDVIAFSPTGQINCFATDFSFDCFDQAVSSTGKTLLHLDHRRWGGKPNQFATSIVDDQRTIIHGIGYLVCVVEERFKMRVWATYEEVANAIENLRLSADPFIEGIGVQVPQQEVYATTQEDLFAIESYLERC